MNINKAIQTAFENHQKGNLPQAELLYKKILSKQPDNPDILHMLGVLYCQLTSYDSAIKYIRKSLQFRPANFEAYCNLGVALHEEGRLDEAITYYQKSIELNPSFAKAYCNLGNALHEEGRLDEAITHYQKAIEFNPSFANAYCNLGNALQEKGLFDESITHSQKAIELDPSFAKAYNNLGIALREKGLFDEAITYYQKSIELNPSFAEAYCNLGNALTEKEQFDEAIIQYHKALDLNPSFVKAYCSLGVALQKKEQLDEAIAQYYKALDLNPSCVEAYCSLGDAHQEKGQLDKAITYFHKALDLNPHSEIANFGMALPLLLAGNFREGWKKYEWRLKAKYFLKKSCLHQPSEFSQAIWDGSYLEEKSLLIYSEQGVGDEIMFASCFQEVIEQVRSCKVECDKRLITIFSRSFPEAVFIERVKNTDSNASQLPRTDLVIPLGSLPKILRTDIDAFPRRSYLIPDAAKVETWRNRLKTLGDGFAVGISWRGGAVPKVKRQRSIKLEQWAKLFSLSGVHFINLQYGDCKNELMEVKEKLGITIHDWEDADPLKDLDNFAAQITALDLIISVDNSTVHMAGALGKPVWVLLPYIPDWRWLLNRDDSPWYPAIKLFRQPSRGEWETVVNKVKDELLKLSDKN